MAERRQHIWFWQTEVSPHMAGLAVALARLGCKVTYVAERLISDSRSRQGWSLPDLGEARIELATTVAGVRSLVDKAPPGSIHVCQGIRGNGLVGEAQLALFRRNLQQWILMEAVNDYGWLGLVKRLEYGRLFRQWRGHIQGILAIGIRTPAWVTSWGMPMERVFPFAYFLSSHVRPIGKIRVAGDCFRFIFVGRLDEGKRVDLLISALASLKRADVELEIVGNGCLERSLRIAARKALPDRVTWSGQIPMHLVSSRIVQADCLVLPSSYDGWGAVVSEALLVGTPVICSDRCGSEGVVRASGIGGVFPSGNKKGLSARLAEALARGRQSFSDRSALANWAECLGADSGARYMLKILDFMDGYGSKPLVPWEKT